MLLEQHQIFEDNILSQRCNVSFNKYEGPLELLLFLVKKEEVDIFEVPVIDIIEQYIEFVDYMEEIDLDIAGEYLVIASSLVELKAKMMLPNFLFDEEEQEEIEAMKENFRDLLMRYREYREELERRAHLESRFFPKGAFPEQKKYDGKQDLPTLDLMNLVKVAHNLFTSETEEFEENISFRERIDISERIEYIKASLEEEEKIEFRKLFREESTSLTILATFMALLELVKRQEIKVFQVDSFNEIVLAVFRN